MRVSPLIVAIAVAALAAGCGGDDDGGGGGDRLSQAEFVSQANAICKDIDTKLDDLGEPQSMEELGEFAKEARDIFDEGLSDLRELEPPEDLEEDYDALLESGERSLGTIEDVVDAAEDGDDAAVQRAAEQGEAEDATADEIATRLDLTECSND